MTHLLTIVCQECRATYTVDAGTSTKSQGLVLDYARCPACGVPRFPKKLEGIGASELCVKCGVPRTRAGSTPARGLCGRCYFHDRREREANAEATT